MLCDGVTTESRERFPFDQRRTEMTLRIVSRSKHPPPPFRVRGVVLCPCEKRDRGRVETYRREIKLVCLLMRGCVNVHERVRPGRWTLPGGTEIPSF